ncbi:hypothetical protein OIU79_023084 [Salix purpurea]|uniref:Uncharacterized protein n=1 Tax=Salix purpurea TaxID=77065 RepID=A0A9Q1ADB4_SALPP|nr:hypothetical protein OIU79_023084 [Salix purpurea]
MATALSWKPQLPTRIHRHSHPCPFIDAGTGHAFQCSIHRRPIPSIHSGKALAFRRDFDRFAKDAWRTANDGFEQFLFEAKKTAERIDRRYSVSRRLSAVAQSASDRARDIDRDKFSGDKHMVRDYNLEIGKFVKNAIEGVLLLFFSSGLHYLGGCFRFFIFATWVLPIAGPLLIGTLANNLVIKGACPACKRQFVGYKNQVIRCGGCGNIVWQPKGPGGGPGDFFSGGGRGTRSSKSDPEIIDVDFEEKP